MERRNDMAKWEYKTLRKRDLGLTIFSSRRSAEAMNSHLNNLGNQGWELVQFNFRTMSEGGIAALLKRRKS